MKFPGIESETLPIRILFDVFLVFSIFFLPAWCALLFALLLVVLFEAPEALFFTFVADLLYGTPREIFYGNELLLTTVVAAVYVATILAKRYFRFGFS